MRYKLIFVLLTFIVFPLFSVETGIISGRVIEFESKSPVPFANVVLLDKTGNNISIGTITDTEGRFVLQGIYEGDYLLSVSFVGYETKTLAVLVGKLNKNFNVGKLEIKASATTLDEVTVSARKEIVSAGLDKKSFNIENNISQTGGSLMDAMRNVPGVTIDPEGKVLLRGSDKVTVLIDGKQSSLTGFGNQKGLENIPASNIERIEIINNPSAKYDAKGLAGIINIVFKKEHETGFNGDFGLNIGVGELTQRKENLPNIMEKYSFTPKLNPAININYRSKNYNLFLQTDGMVRKKVNTNEFTSRTYKIGNPDIISQFLENRTQELYNIKGGFDWYINERNKLTLYALFEDEYHIDRGHVPYDYVSNGKRKRFWTWAEDENTRFINYGANYVYNFSQPGHLLEAGFVYTKGGENELFPFTDSSAVRNSTDQTHLLVNEIVTNLNVDYVRPLRWGRLEFGGKLQLRDIPISYKISPGVNSVLDPYLGEWSEYIENMVALYGNIVHETKLIDIEGGLRLEHTNVSYVIDPANIYYNKNDAYNYFELFPNIRFTFKINERNKISVFYNRRIDRPGEFELRPFPKYDDPEILKTGNPYLRPQYTQIFELAYKKQWKDGSVYFAGFYRLINDIFDRVYTNDTSVSTTIINSIPQNLGKGTNLGFEIAAEHKISEKWDVNASFNWYANTINAFSGHSIYPYNQSFSFTESKSNTWSFKLNNNIKLPFQTDLQLSGVYYAPNIIPQGKIRERYTVDMGLKKKAFNNKAEFILSATDLFNTFSIRKTILSEDFTLNSENYYETQVIFLGMKYKF